MTACDVSSHTPTPQWWSVGKCGPVVSVEVPGLTLDWVITARYKLSASGYPTRYPAL